MNAIPAILTSTALLIHSVLGCCWHHVHACDSDHGPEAAASVEHGVQTCDHDHSHGCHGHRHDVNASGSDDPAPPSHPCDGRHSGGESCDGADCLTIAVKPVDSKLQLEFAMSLVVDARDQDAVDRTSHRPDARPSTAPWQQPAAPLRALTQTWLL